MHNFREHCSRYTQHCSEFNSFHCPDFGEDSIFHKTAQNCARMRHKHKLQKLEPAVRKKITPPGMMEAPPQGPPQYHSTVMFGGFQGSPMMPKDASLLDSSRGKTTSPGQCSCSSAVVNLRYCPFRDFYDETSYTNVLTQKSPSTRNNLDHAIFCAIFCLHFELFTLLRHISRHILRLPSSIFFLDLDPLTWCILGVGFFS